MLSIKDGDVPQPRSGRFVHNNERKKNGIQQRTVDTHSWHLFNQKTIMFQLLMEHSWFSAPGPSGKHCCPLQESLDEPGKAMENTGKPI